MTAERNSAAWMPDIKELGQIFYDAKPCHKRTAYRMNVFPAINDSCNKMAGVVRAEMYPYCVAKDDCLMDWHKIFAIHVVSILKNQPYIPTGSGNEGGIFDRLANEYYCLLLLKTIARAWHKSDGKDCYLEIPEDYEQLLIKIFYKYKKSGWLRLEDTAFIYALASIAYFVEKNYLACQPR